MITPRPRPVLPQLTIDERIEHHDLRTTVPVPPVRRDAPLPTPTQDTNAWCLRATEDVLVAVLELVGSAP